MRKIILLLFFALGFFSLLAQTLVIREFLIAFGGAELGIGLFYFFWLFWVGAGALCARRWPIAFGKHFLAIAVSYPVLAVGEVVLFMNLRQCASVNFWEFFSAQKVFLCLFLFTAPVSFCTGILFAVAAGILARNYPAGASSVIGRAYGFEAAGSFLAGCVATAFFSWHVPAIAIITGAGLFFTLVVFLASWRAKRKVMATISAALAALFMVSFFFMPNLVSLSARMHKRNIFPAGRLHAEVTTPYQHLLLAQLAETMVIVSNGEILTTIPNQIDADYESALFMAQAPRAREILVVGLGAENLIRSLLAFPVTRITYCLADRAYYEAIKQYLPLDARLTVVCKPPRVFLASRHSFDLIVVRTPEPADLFINAFYTREFYELARRNLSRQGIIATAITGAENFMGTQVRDYGSSLYYTLRSVFEKIVIVPQERSWFLAGGSASNVSEDPEILARRLAGILPLSSAFKPEGFASVFLPDRLTFFKDMYIENPLFKGTGLYNTDRRPLTFFLHTLVMARYSRVPLAVPFTRAFFSGFFVFCVPLCIFFIARFMFLARIENIPSRRLSLHAAIFQFVSGFLGFSFHLCLLFMFQNRFGTVFVFIGILNALFMLGLAAGGFTGRILTRRFSPAFAAAGVLILQGILVLFGCVFFAFLGAPAVFVYGLFIILFFACGFLTGSSYPLAAAIFERTRPDVTSNAAILTVLDHSGGAIAGAITGLLLLPLAGLTHALVILALVACFAAGLCAFESRRFGVLLKNRNISFLSFPYIRVSCVLIATALSFLFLHYFLASPALTQSLRLQTPALSAGCVMQEEPFRAQVCSGEHGREYIVDSKDFVDDIKGFSGPLRLSVRFDDQGEIKEVNVIEQQETALYVREFEKFLAQFSGRRVTELFSRDTVDAMSGATVTSDAVIRIVDRIACVVRDPLRSESSIQKTPLVIFDVAFWYGCVVSCGAIILYCLPVFPLLRIVFLFGIVIFSGFIFNHSFSVTHLAHILALRPIPLAVLSAAFVFLAPLIAGIFFGQLWCGWLCPFGALQELIGFRARVPARIDKKARYGKYMILFGVVCALVFSSPKFLFAHEPLSVFFARVPVRFKLLGCIGLFFSLFFPRFWCRYFCAVGAFLSFFNKVAIFRRWFPKRYAQCPYRVSGPLDIDCIQCNMCMKRS